MFTLSSSSEKLLKGVHPDLVKVVRRAIEISDVDFRVTEGLRTLERQKEMVRTGKSKTLNSRHLTGHAVDVVPIVNGKASYDWPLYYKLAPAFKRAAKELNVDLEWGGDWKSFKDGPHFQLSFKKYPASQKFGTNLGEKYSLETEKTAAKKAVAVVSTGVAAASPISYEPLIKAVDVVTQQQSELSSGDYIRIGLALLIVVGSIFIAYKKWSS